MSKRDSCWGCPDRSKCVSICGRLEALLPSLDAQGGNRAPPFADLPGRVRSALGTDLYGNALSMRYSRQRMPKHASQGADAG